MTGSIESSIGRSSGLPAWSISCSWEDFRPVELLSESTRTEWVMTPAVRLAFEVGMGV
jgi:hypothetical protein